MNDTKQVIVMRTEYPDGKGGTVGLRKGKLVAQGSHASIAFLTRRLQKIKWWQIWKWFAVLSKDEWAWIQGSFAKICLQVASEEELLEVYKAAKEAGLEVHLIMDSGRTEFKEPTRTCIAIGPHESSKIDKVTGKLKLY